MSQMGGAGYVCGRKEHRCEICYGLIPKGEFHWWMKGLWDSEWQNWRAHEECMESTETEDGFCPGDGPMPERIKALYEEVSR